MSAFALVRIIWGGAMFLAGIWVVAAPRAFYAHTPGLSLESVYDTHLLRDVGLTFLAFGVGLLGSFRSAPAAIAIAWTLVVYLVEHAILHTVQDLVVLHRSSLFAIEAPAVYGIAGLGTAIAIALVRLERRDLQARRPRIQ
jgi:hypothetical protein